MSKCCRLGSIRRKKRWRNFCVRTRERRRRVWRKVFASKKGGEILEKLRHFVSVANYRAKTSKFSKLKTNALRDQIADTALISNGNPEFALEFLGWKSFRLVCTHRAMKISYQICKFKGHKKENFANWSIWFLNNQFYSSFPTILGWYFQMSTAFKIADRFDGWIFKLHSCFHICPLQDGLLFELLQLGFLPCLFRQLMKLLAIFKIAIKNPP